MANVEISYAGGSWAYPGGGLHVSYPAACRHARENGHEVNNLGWRRKMLMSDFTYHSIDGYPDWEVERVEHGRNVPAFVKLSHVRGKDEVESSEICFQWDDIADGDFYTRDWTDDGIPFVRDGETYWSGWWFQTLAERDRFVSWITKNHVGLSFAIVNG